MHKFKVGDRVKIKSWCKDMNKYDNKIVVITEIKFTDSTIRSGYYIMWKQNQCPGAWVEFITKVERKTHMPQWF